MGQVLKTRDPLPLEAVAGPAVNYSWRKILLVNVDNLCGAVGWGGGVLRGYLTTEESSTIKYNREEASIFNVS